MSFSRQPDSPDAPKPETLTFPEMTIPDVLQDSSRTPLQTQNAQKNAPPKDGEACDTRRRDKILDTACALLREHGFHETSMDCIARHAGMSKKTLYQLFSSKQDLFEQLLLERLFPPLGAEPDEGPDMENALTTYFRRLAVVTLDDERIALLRAVIGETNRSEAIQTAMTEALHLSGRKTGMRTWIGARQAEGRLKKGDPITAADQLFGATLAIPMLTRLTHCVPPRTPEALDLFLCEGVRAFLQAWKADLPLLAETTLSATPAS